MSRVENPRNKVLEVYPKAVCKKARDSESPHWLYFVFEKENGVPIAGAYDAASAWKNAAAKLNKRVNSS